MTWERAKNILWSILFIILIVTAGLFCFNQLLEYRYKAIFLSTPCELCAQTNPGQAPCIEKCFIIKTRRGDVQPIWNVTTNFSKEELELLHLLSEE